MPAHNRADPINLQLNSSDGSAARKQSAEWNCGLVECKMQAVNKNLVDECSFPIFRAFPRTAALSSRPFQSIKGSMNWTIFSLFKKYMWLKDIHF